MLQEKLESENKGLKKDKSNAEKAILEHNTMTKKSTEHEELNSEEEITKRFDEEYERYSKNLRNPHMSTLGHFVTAGRQSMLMSDTFQKMKQKQLEKSKTRNHIRKQSRLMQDN
jgi:hypothetical protein